MKPLVSSILIFFFISNILISASGFARESNDINLLSSNQNGLTFSFRPSNLQANYVKADRGGYIRLEAEGMYPGGIIGGPELPVLRRLIELPLQATASVEVYTEGSDEFFLASVSMGSIVYPYQPSPCKHPDSVSIFRYEPALYVAEAQRREVEVYIEDLGIMRNKRLALVEVRPYQYDFSAGIIRYPKEIIIGISFEGADYEATHTLKSRTFSPLFDVPGNMLLGGGLQTASISAPNHLPVKYVIVSDPMFQSQLQPFIAWKKKKGFTVVEAYTNNPAVGNTTASIKSYLADLYQNATSQDPAPSYLLIVGDIAQVPAFNGTTGSHVTDLYYAEYTGDKMPELYYGRFSATNAAQLQPQIDKTLQYEKYLMPDPSFLGKSVMVSGVDSYNAATHGNGQITYGTNLYFNSSNGISSYTYLYPASGSNASNIRQHVSEGVGYANYTAHGGTNGWSDPAFTTSHISSLNNVAKYPLMVGNACLTNSFQVDACFGEALLRADGKGAIGYIGASNNTYWDEDFYWGVGFGSISSNPTYAGTGLGAYDRTFHTHGEPYSAWYVTQGQMVQAGNLAVVASGSSRIAYYWEVYHLMGDPSLMVYFGMPPALSITHAPFMTPMATSFTVQTVPHTYVALSRAGVLHGAAFADSTGVAHIQVAPFVTSGLVDIVATRQNRQPYVATINVTSPAGPYIIVDDIAVVPGPGGNPLLESGQEHALSVIMTNAGMQTSSALQLSLSTSDVYIQVIDSAENHTGLAPGTVDTVFSAFLIRISPHAPDQHNGILNIRVVSTTDTLDYTKQITIAAPMLKSVSSTVIDTTGNANGHADPGETITYSLMVMNEGQAAAMNVRSSIQIHSPYIHCPQGSFPAISMLPGELSAFHFPLIISSAAPQGYVSSFSVILETDSAVLLIDTIQLQLGFPIIAVIDLDPNRSSANTIVGAIKTNGLSTHYSQSLPSNLPNFQAVFVSLGIYSQNYKLSQADGTMLAQYLNQGGRLYMEGGDTWYYDPKTPVHNLFNINGISDGSADLGTIVGANGRFTAGMSFPYTGENNWIDRLTPLGAAFTILSNSNPAYATGVAFSSTSYRTIGVSHEFSGLVDGGFPSTKSNLMHEYLSFFGLTNPPLNPGFQANQQQICAGDPVLFTDTTSGMVSSYYWTFEGGTPPVAETQQPAVIWDNPGQYRVTLTVSNGLQAYTLIKDSFITVEKRPQVVMHPQDVSVQEGAAASFACEAVDAISLQWFSSQNAGLNWNPVMDDSLYNGAQTNLLTIVKADTTMSGSMFRCQILGSCLPEVYSNHAMLEVIPITGVHGKIYYAGNDSSLMKDLMLQAIDSSGNYFEAWVANAGKYYLPLSSPNHYGLSVSGNFVWGGANSTDALIVLRHFVGLTTLTGIHLKAADVDANGVANASDAMLISKRFVGLSSSFPLGDWVIDPDTYQFQGGLQQLDIGFLYSGDVDASYKQAKHISHHGSWKNPVRPTTDNIYALQLSLDAMQSLAAVSLVMDWPGNWELIEVVPASPDEGFLHWTSMDGVLRLSWFNYASYNIYNADALFTFKVRLTGDNMQTPFMQVHYLQCADNQGQSLGDVKLMLDYPLPGTSLTISNPYPIPNQGRLHWPVYSDEGGVYHLDVYDITGRLCSSLRKQALSPGYQSLVIGLNLKKGSYLAVFTVETPSRQWKTQRIPILLTE